MLTPFCRFHFCQIYLSMPRIGCLDQALHIFGYLRSHPKSKLGFDPAHPDINESRFQGCEWA